MKKIMIAFVAIAFASAIAFAETAAAPAATTTPAATTAAAAPAVAAPVALAGTISKVVAANKATPEQIVIKGADGKEITLDLDKASTLKGADGKAITAKALKAGAKVNATYTAGDKANVLVTLDIAK